MSTPCPGCNKLCGLEMSDPEMSNDLEVDTDGHVTGFIRIVRTSACCSEEMKEAEFEVDWSPAAEQAALIEKHQGEEHELKIDADDPEATERTEGKGRGMKSFYGASVHFTITCSCEPEEETEPLSVEDTWSDDIQASSMDTCC